jgi:hypothetical protein
MNVSKLMNDLLKWPRYNGILDFLFFPFIPWKKKETKMMWVLSKNGMLNSLRHFGF